MTRRKSTPSDETEAAEVSAAFNSVKHGGNDERVDSSDITTIVDDFLALSNFRGRHDTAAPAGRDFHFSDNESFWKTAPRMYEGATVLLENFALMEWAPAAPGRYHTAAAADARRRALQFVAHSRTEYLPLGKMNMVLGGVGSVRLAHVSALGERSYFLGASSTGVSHAGIPICVGRDLYREVIPLLKDDGACDCTIVGQLELLPEAFMELEFPTGIPRLVIHAENIKVLRRRQQASISVSALFLGAAREYEKGRKAPQDIGWTFANFDPCHGRPEQELEGAVEWLKEYVSRHSALDDAPVVCDFDQHVRHFGENVMFSIADVVRGGIDIELLRRFTRKFQLTINVDQVGDRFENVVNSRISNRSILLRGNSTKGLRNN